MICPNPDCLADNNFVRRTEPHRDMKLIVRERICNECGALMRTVEKVHDFEMNPQRNRYKSLQSLQRRERRCKYCGKPFPAKGKKVFCKVKCRVAHFRSNN